MRLHFAKQPGSRVGPVTFGRRNGIAHDLRRLRKGEPAKEAQFNEFGLSSVMRGQAVERVVHRENLVVVCGRGDVNAVKIHLDRIAAMAKGLAPTGVVNKNTPHRFGRRGKEMSLVVPIGLVVAAQAEPGFVDQRRGLEGLAGSFSRHLLRSQSAQLVIYQRQPLRGILRAARLNRLR